MSLNIKNEETYRLVQELAGLTGESMTGAVTTAVKDRLERLQRQSKAPERVRRVLALTDGNAARIRAAGGPIDPDALLYDESGLPKQ